MTPFAWGFLIGLLVGANVGLLVLSLLVAARGDAPPDPVSRRQAEAEQRVWDAINQPEYEEHA